MKKLEGKIFYINQNIKDDYKFFNKNLNEIKDHSIESLQQAVYYEGLKNNKYLIADFPRADCGNLYWGDYTSNFKSTSSGIINTKVEIGNPKNLKEDTIWSWLRNNYSFEWFIGSKKEIDLFTNSILIKNKAYNKDPYRYLWSSTRIDNGAYMYSCQENIWREDRENYHKYNLGIIAFKYI